MKYLIKILRRKSADDKPFWQTFSFETELKNATAATALSEINSKEKNDKIIWECSCLQKKCGACAMVINGKPKLACDALLSELANKNGEIIIEPLKKFPVIADLAVDRSILYENLKTIKVWLNKDTNENTYADENKNDILYEASRCLQCGCCLEICPNFCIDEKISEKNSGNFFGMASMVPVSRLLEEMSPEKRKDLSRNYKKYIYSGCGKSLSCRNICPANIEIEKLLVNSNAIAVWNLFRKNK